jgi:hypothetical protein
MVRVYPAMADKKDQISYWNDFFKTKDQIRATVEYEGHDYQGSNLVLVNFKLKIKSRVRDSRLPFTELNPLYQAELVKLEGDWKIAKIEERR